MNFKKEERKELRKTDRRKKNISDMRKGKGGGERER